MKAIIMAGGKGTRLYDSENPSPKVLRKACGRPLISYVFDSINFILCRVQTGTEPAIL